MYAVTPAGAASLKRAGIISPAVPVERGAAGALSRMVEHQLLLNWVAIQCRELDRARAGFRVRFISSASPFHLSTNGRTVLADRVEFADGAELGFVPDAAFSIGHAALERSLLFFLEVDTGTETVTDLKGRHDQDLWGKVVVYRTYFIRKEYRRYESDALFGSPFRGFQLLIVCASDQRARAVCQMVVRNRPSDFVWVAAAPDLLRHGLGGRVWRRGGNLEEPASSILGRLAPRPFTVENARFSATAGVTVYHLDELLGTKLRALYQRKKGRDLYDLWLALAAAKPSPDRIVECFQRYMAHDGMTVSRAEFEANLAAKLASASFLQDLRVLVPPEIEYDPVEAAQILTKQLVAKLQGEPWKGSVP